MTMGSQLDEEGLLGAAQSNQTHLFPKELQHFVRVTLSQSCILQSELIVFVFAFRFYNRLRSLVKDPRFHCVQFANEFQQYSFCPREKGESQEKWQTR